MSRDTSYLLDMLVWARRVQSFNDGSFGHWDFLEISDPWDAANTIRAALSTNAASL